MRPAFAVHNLSPMVEATFLKANVFADILSPYADKGQDVDVLLATSMYHLSAVSIASFHYELGCIEVSTGMPIQIELA